MAVALMDFSLVATQVAIILAAIATWVRPEAVSNHRAVFLGLALAMVTTETSPYTQSILIFFVFMERWEGWLRPLAITVCYILCFPGEIRIGGDLNTIQFSYLANQYVVTSQGLGLSMIVRPFIFMLPPFFLSAHTLAQVAKRLANERSIVSGRLNGDRWI